MKDLRRLQLVEFEGLLEIDKICKKHNIKYFSRDLAEQFVTRASSLGMTIDTYLPKIMRNFVKL